MKKYTIGIDFGTLSGRAVLVRVADGTVVAESALSYPHGVMDEALPDGTPLPLGQGKSYVCIISPKSSTLTYN